MVFFVIFIQKLILSFRFWRWSINEFEGAVKPKFHFLMMFDHHLRSELFPLQEGV